ncbi:hypothetical protein F4824DRAFT_46348 [Ustulina deusta]|nr:hypothetical protein F4824DRAFT_46348 [Ustulina deusta]
MVFVRSFMVFAPSCLFSLLGSSLNDPPYAITCLVIRSKQVSIGLVVRIPACHQHLSVPESGTQEPLNQAAGGRGSIPRSRGHSLRPFYIYLIFLSCI